VIEHENILQEHFESPPDRFDVAIEVLLATLLIFSPLAMGVVEAWSEQVVIGLAGAMVTCLALKFLLRRDAKPVLSWAYLPLGLFLLFVVFQLIPLPEGFLRLISPHTVEVKKNLLSDLPGPGNLAVTFYPAGTVHDLRLALVVAAVFVCAVHVYRRPGAVRRLLTVVATLGGVLAVLAIAQIVTGTEKIYWLIETSKTKVVRGGSFVNRNNFCMFMNLSLGASLALLLLKINDGLENIPKTLPNVLNWITSPDARWVWILSGVIVVSMAAVFLSLGRGGVIALLLAATLTSMVMAIRRRLDGRAWIMVVLTLGAFICVLFLGFDAVYDRLSTLEDQHAYEGRWSIAKNAALAWTRFPLVGAGFGTHEVVFPMFNRAKGPSLYEYVENEYAQTAEETGALGLVLVAGFAFLVWRQYRRCLGSGGERTAVAYGLGFSLVAALVHSVSDFGLHLPANGCLTAVFCGVLVGLGARPATSGGFTRKLLAPLGVVCVLAVWGWALYTANECRMAEKHWKQAMRMENWMQKRNWLAGNQPYANLISHAAAAVDWFPGNIHYRFWLAMHRWRSISRVVDPKVGKITLTPKSREYAGRIVADLHEARRVCPTFGPVYCVAGQLERFILDRKTGADHIRRGYELAPSHPTTCFVAGLLEVQEGNLDESLIKFERALELDGNLFGEVCDILVLRAKKPEKAVELAGEDMKRLTFLEARLSAIGEHKTLAEEVRGKVTTKLKKLCESPDAPAAMLARLGNLSKQQKDYEAAARYFCRALDRKYGQVHWRMQLARVYADSNRIKEAIEQADICLQLRPQLVAAKNLIRTLKNR